MMLVHTLRNKSVLIVGLGKTGLSTARYLARHGVGFDLADERVQGDTLSALDIEFPNAAVTTAFLGDAFSSYDVLIVSPGIAVAHPALQQALANDVAVIGDIDLFAAAVTKPMVAVTGSNGKSTVVAMIGAMAQAANKNACLCGNYGLPVLDKVDDDSVDCFVVELSSFQLETMSALHVHAASILNVSEDHQDRYPTFGDYVGAKQKIYANAACRVANRKDENTWPRVEEVSGKTVYFSDDAPTSADDYGIREQAGVRYLVHGNQQIVPVEDLAVPGLHNASNALAAIALAGALEIPVTAMVAGLNSFTGLPHRMQLVAEKNGMRWFNDSKGTNVGATVQAISGMGAPVVLIAGGVGKAADFSPLAAVVAESVKAVILLGRDAAQIAAALEPAQTPISFAESLHDAVTQAATVAVPGDVILFSPACASFDMFRNFEERGDAFVREVLQEVA